MTDFFWPGSVKKKANEDYESSGFSDSVESEVTLLRTKNMELRSEIDDIKTDIKKKVKRQVSSLWSPNPNSGSYLVSKPSSLLYNPLPLTSNCEPLNP